MQSWKFAPKGKILTVILCAASFCKWLSPHVILIPCYCIQCCRESKQPYSQADRHPALVELLKTHAVHSRKYIKYISSTSFT